MQTLCGTGIPHPGAKHISPENRADQRKIIISQMKTGTPHFFIKAQN